MTNFKPTILYVEDEISIREELVRFLKRFSSRLYIGVDGLDGLDIFKKELPDIVVSDIQMPNMNGIDMAKAIKKINSKQYIIFTTAQDESQYFLDAIDMQVEGYIIKPIDLEQLEDKLDNIINHIKVQLDNTKHIEKEFALNRSIELFSKHILSTTTNTQGVIVDVTDSFCEISGYKKSEILGKNHNIIGGYKSKKETFEILCEVIENGKVWEGELKNYKKSGEPYWVNTTIIPTLDSDNTIVGYTSIMNNITSKKSKEEFMANMSHELRTPLNAIIGFSSILKKRLEKEENLKISKQIYNSSELLLLLINDILDLSKIENANFNIEPYKFNGYDEVSIFINQFEALQAEKHFHFQTNIDKNLNAILFGDWNRIRQIILNLISNAIKFTPTNGKISFSMEYINSSLYIIVSDNGIGMDKNTQDRIFKPFEQADGSITRKYGGTGLGLSIVQNLVDIMHGKIELKSLLGEYTTFEVTIPIEKVKATKIEKIEIINKEEKNPLKGHVLIVEDIPTNQLLITMLLERFGITTDVANDGLEAIKVYDPDIHDLILMDENMPNMHGIEAMKILRKKYENRCGKIIVLTANAMVDDRARFINEGMDDYLSKPIDIEKLYMIMRKHLKTEGKK